MNNISRVTVILASLASLVAIVWILNRGDPPRSGSRDPLPPIDQSDLVRGTPEPITIPPQPSRHPVVNDVATIINIRRPNHIYRTEVVGQISGVGVKKDWGFRGEAKFNMTYNLVSTGDVVSNDGRVIVEDRSFSYKEVLTLDTIRAGLSLSEGQAWAVAAIVGGLGELITKGAPTGELIVAAKSAIDGANGRMFEVSSEDLNLYSRIAKWTGIPSQDLASGLKLELPRPEFSMLDGKTVRLRFEDGKGITELKPIGCQISPREREAITRTNNLADHYIFPKRDRAVGATWTVKADNLGCLLDPRLQGIISESDIILKRLDDSVDESGIGLVVNVGVDSEQRITIAKSAGSRQITGEMKIDEARFELPSSAGVVTSVSASGVVEYKSRTVDHLLFDAEIRGRPSFKVYARTTIQKKAE